MSRLGFRCIPFHTTRICSLRFDLLRSPPVNRFYGFAFLSTRRRFSSALFAFREEQRVVAHESKSNQPAWYIYHQQQRSTSIMTNPNHKRKNKSKPFGYGKKKKNGGNDGDRSDRSKHNSRRPDWDDKDIKDPHAGSFAHPTMRELFGVELTRPLGIITSPTIGTSPSTTISTNIDGECKSDTDQTPSSKESSSDRKHGDKKEDLATSAAADEANVADEAEKPSSSVAAPTENGTATVRKPKRKVALLLAFVGTKYAGFQMNAEKDTLHARIELALYEANFLSDTNFGFPHKYSWSNSARTDKGVHACAQVCSVKLELPNEMVESMDRVRAAINGKLPLDIQCLDVVRTTRAFCARTQRDRVRYQYMIPSFLFYDRTEFKNIIQKEGIETTERSGIDPLTPAEVAKLRPMLANFRASPEQIAKLRDTLSMYDGTHSFHSFTRGIKPNDPKRQRFIHKFVMQDAVVMDDGTEWIPTQVLGQSFLLNQIRKMISLAVDVARGVTGKETITQAFSDERVMKLNIAPAQGLFLDMSIFDHYNERFAKDGADALEWSDSTSDDPAIQRWKKFKEEVIMPHVVEEEARDGNFIKYLFVQEYIFGEKHYDPSATVAVESNSEGEDALER